MQRRFLATLGTMALAVVLGSGTARADLLELGSTYNYPISMSVGVSPTLVTRNEGGGSINPSKLNHTVLPWVYCVDFFDSVSAGGTYPSAVATTDGTIAGSKTNDTDSNAMASGKGGLVGFTSPGVLTKVYNVIAVAWLLHTYASAAVGNTDNQIGLQAAIWHTIYSHDGFTMDFNGTGSALAAYKNDLDTLTALGSNVPDHVAEFTWLSPNGSSTTVAQGLVTRVPDGGVTLMLLGGALVGLESLRRKLSA